MRETAQRSGLDCEVFADGMAVQVDFEFEPDASVRSGERLPGGVARISDPVIVVEVPPPSTEKRDLATKLSGYFRLKWIRHYLILGPDEAMLIHHARRPGGAIETATMMDGRLLLDPPGLQLDVAALFAGVRGGNAGRTS